jgi:transposase
MVYAALDIHKHVFQAALFDADSGEVVQQRFPATRESLDDWAMPLRGRVAAVAIEATTGWRWVARELIARGFDVRLVDPVQARGLRGRTRSPKTDRLDARWLAVLLAKEILPESWLPPAEIQELRDRTRLRKAIANDRTRWAQRLHALLVHEGWPCERGRLLTQTGQRWLTSLALPPAARAQVDVYLRLLASLEREQRALETELRRFARSDRRCQALETIYGIGPLLACHILAELGQASRFRRARQVIRAAGLDPVVSDSGQRRRRGRLAKQGSPQLRFALVEAAKQAHRRTSPDHTLYRQAARRGSHVATLTVARKLGRRAYQLLNELEHAA